MTEQADMQTNALIPAKPQGGISLLPWPQRAQHLWGATATPRFHLSVHSTPLPTALLGETRIPMQDFQVGRCQDLIFEI